MPDNAQNKIITFNYASDNEIVQKTLFIPGEIYNKYPSFEKPKNAREELIGNDREKICELYLKNGAFLCGKNALIKTHGHNRLTQYDYDENGMCQEWRWYPHSGILMDRSFKPEGKEYDREQSQYRLSMHHNIRDGKIKVTFNNFDGKQVHFTYRKAGRYGLMNNAEFSYNNGLKITQLNDHDMKGTSEREEFNRDIKTILANPSTITHITRYKELAEIILPLQETVNLIKNPGPLYVA